MDNDTQDMLAAMVQDIVFLVSKHGREIAVLAYDTWPESRMLLCARYGDPAKVNELLGETARVALPRQLARQKGRC